MIITKDVVRDLLKQVKPALQVDGEIQNYYFDKNTFVYDSDFIYFGVVNCDTAIITNLDGNQFNIAGNTNPVLFKNIQFVNNGNFSGYKMRINIFPSQI